MAGMIVTGSSVAAVWTAALDAVAAPGATIIRPLVATIDAFSENGEACDVPEVRTLANTYLQSIGAPLVETTARLIFPRSYWRPDRPRSALFERFAKNYPRIKRASPKNRYGTYFRRLTAYPDSPSNGNQLENAITLVRNGIKRGSALQAAIFDPRKDLAGQPSRGFPCLQQVMFTVDDGRVCVSGVYARQYVDERGYGNYLGLCWLGLFFAHEVRLPLYSVTCIATAASLSKSKNAARQFLQQSHDLLKER